MSSSTNPDRPNRLVMGLGIATIVLFSVNLLAMLSQRVWPKLQDLELFESQDAVEEVAPLVALQKADRHAVYSFVTTKRNKRCHKRHDHHSIEVQIDRSIDSDLDRLEREIESEMERLDVELSDAASDLEEAISLKLHMDSPNAIVLRKRNLAELEEKVAGIAKTFEVRVREHENAARSAYSRVRVRPNN